MAEPSGGQFAALLGPATVAAIATIVAAVVSALGRILGGTLLAVAPVRIVLAMAGASSLAILAYAAQSDGGVGRATIFLSGLWAGILVPYAIAYVRSGGKRADPEH